MTETQHGADSASPVQVPAEIQAAPQIAVPNEAPGEVVPSGAATLEAAHAGFAEFHEGYVRHYIGLADTKAAWTFTIASGVIAFLFGSDKFQGIMAGPVHGFPFLLFSVTMLLLVISAACSFLVIAPRLTSSVGEEIVYFGAVARRKSGDEYVRDISSKSENDLIEARLKHCYDISEICARKYKYLRKAIWFGLPGLVGMAIVLLLA